MSEKNNLNPREDFEKDFNEEIEKENNVYRVNKKSVKRTRNRRIITGGLYMTRCLLNPLKRPTKMLYCQAHCGLQ